MSQLVIQGQARLKGEVAISGSKNAALKIIAASLLATKPITVKNVPRISDVDVMLALIGQFDVDWQWIEDHTLRLDPRHCHPADPSSALVKKLRASFVLVGPCLARFGAIQISLPGGDQIGRRPLTAHTEAFRQMGVVIESSGDQLKLLWQKKRQAAVFLPEISVTATENAILASVLGEHQTTIYGAAIEPEIGNLIVFLKTLGAKIDGQDTAILKIQGVKQLLGGEVAVIPDRIETGTLIMAGLITRGHLKLTRTNPTHSSYLIPRLKAVGADLDYSADTFIVRSHHRPLKAINIDTRTYPGFYSDLQSPMAALLTQADGTSRIFETLYESRFNYIDQLKKMGAQLSVLEPHTLEIIGPTPLHGQYLEAPADIRAGGALVVAALAAQGTSTVANAEIIDRGYEQIEHKLSQLGAKIKRVSE